MWVVDTCLVLDVLEPDPAFGLLSARCLQERLPEGLCVSPITMVELSPAFGGDLQEQKRFLDLAGIIHEDPWTTADTATAHQAWNACVQAKRREKIAKRPVADLLIGAFARRRSGLITRNPENFRPWFPGLTILEP